MGQTLLAELIDAWPALSEAIKGKVLAIVRVAGGQAVSKWTGRQSTPSNRASPGGLGPSES